MNKEFDESIVKDKGSAHNIIIEDGDAKEAEQAEAEEVTEAADAQTEESADADDIDDTETETESAEASESEEDEEAEDDSDASESEEEPGVIDGKSSFFKKDKKKKKSARVLEVELEKAEAKVAEMTDRYQRLMAEFENARKRTEKEKSQMFDIGAKAVLEKLLPVVDNFERGLDALSEEEKEGAFAQGVEKIYQQLMTAFTDLGVTAMDAAGKEFNPDLHNAVMHVEDEELPENVVAEEFQKGYMYKDSVLRYSMVKVAN